jgi:hypothetical protein
MKLETYYKESVAKNDALTGGWAPSYYGVFSAVIQENGYRNVAEVGIGYGTHAKYILKNNDIDKLHLVDPMVFYPNDAFSDEIYKCETRVSGVKPFDELHDLICKELDPWSSKYVWHRMRSLEITDLQIPDGSLDCVFVDGDHSYEAVKQDLPFWWRKIRVGGQMLGDDYWMEDVRCAVKEFATLNRVKYDLLCKENTQYPIFRFRKI